MAVGVLGPVISSNQNALVKRAASLRVRKYREREAAFLVEGADLVAAGVAAGRRPQALFVTAGSAAHEAAATAASAAHEAAATALAGLPALAGLAAHPALAGLPTHRVTESVARHISSLATPPDVIAVFPRPQAPPLAQLGGAALVVYTDEISDPGNMGTLIRAAVAFGAAALIASPHSVDLFSPKVVRASMGAVFGLSLYPGTPLSAALAELAGAHVYGLVAHGGRELGETPLECPAVLCVGAERSGLSPQVKAVLDEALTIRLAGADTVGVESLTTGVGAAGAARAASAAVESLNAGVAGAIALYEFSRRRPAAAARPPAPATMQRRRPHG